MTANHNIPLSSTSATNYAVISGSAGTALIATHRDRICWLGFTDPGEATTRRAFFNFWNAHKNMLGPCIEKPEPLMTQALRANWHEAATIPLLLLGTSFQKTVLKQTIKIPHATSISYSALAQQIQSPGAARAVGQALARNPVCWLIPCHRVSSLNPRSKDNNYRWGQKRKHHLQALERKENI